MKTKLKGCRPSHQVAIEFTNTCAALGAAELRIREIKEDQEKIRVELGHLKRELDEARRQEAELAKEECPASDSSQLPNIANLEVVQ